MRVNALDMSSSRVKVPSACGQFFRDGFVMRWSLQQVMVCGSLLLLFYLIYKPSLDPLDLEQQQCTHSSGSLRAEPQSPTVKEELEMMRVSQVDDLPTIYVITPTYKRQEQMAELTRLAQTLMLVRNLHWIVADDTHTENKQVVDYLSYIGIPHTYLLTPMPNEYKKLRVKPRGVANRNAGLQWVRTHAKTGVVYFADDDNTYDIRVFEEMRYTKGVSMWPVGLVTHTGISTPVLKNGKFVGWYDGSINSRKFPVDMACFAFSVSYLLQSFFPGIGKSFRESKLHILYRQILVHILRMFLEAG
ncbi:galactosylgalactosylxylosylprotein 3-beta-glucuronosyltransferase P-like [Homarus americanus]|uniref:galactosylgalactosylxylosylprotein 3-beta-glucuronosyltransferase P-like n=1 Tax=Homarus americanus TaxID=6706 RepID=UPI001C49629B|nr:galactosylgalactosylxylosylprotein 3-beta-glucuronosyltransferase P-like [Homarus americanus]